MPYLVIHQNPIDDQYIRNDYCGDIVVFHFHNDIEIEEYAIDPYVYPEFDTKVIIKNKEWNDYIRVIDFPYDEIDDTNYLSHTRWCEADMIRVFDSYIEMYDHIIVCRRYTVFHHMNSDMMLQYFYKEKIPESNLPSSVFAEYSANHLSTEE